MGLHGGETLVLGGCLFMANRKRTIGNYRLVVRKLLGCRRRRMVVVVLLVSPLSAWNLVGTVGAVTQRASTRQWAAVVARIHAVCFCASSCQRRAL